MTTASNFQTLTIQLSAEDGEKLLAEAKRRGVDAESLALMLLHDSLTGRHPVSVADIESLEKLYTWRGKTEILDFLEKHHFLIPVLLEAPDKISNYFLNAQLFLECVTDPEGIDDDMLELAICMNLEPDEAVDKLNQFQDNWWLNLSNKIRQLLCPILEYPHDF
ncbi:hypothetical protein [Tychonema sp. LEGE 07203]|uniref:hypothetical protein n=1 Tax=Tychonema sp. LEGE 07203 TaxID=1828671 RepID=UPI0018814161|nr:hypothetical protein [Tychonema sp. LEGE 07203]MBE9094176.1 hypothetical protein [Tychonema sp. LEGE 07203]